MTDATFVLDDFTSFDRRPLSRRHSSGTVAGAAALAMALVFGAWMWDAPSSGTGVGGPAETTTRVAVPPVAPPQVAVPKVAAVAAPRPTILPLGFAFSLGVDPVPLERSVPLSSDFVPAAPLASAEPAGREDVAEARIPLPPLPPALPIPPVEAVAEVPVPAPRPTAFGNPVDRSPSKGIGRLMGRRDLASTTPAVAPDNRTFLERFFGMPQPAEPALGYAAPEDGLLGNTRSAIVNPALPRDRWTAVYDIAAHTVYMPNGTRLEAHSGLGDLLDDPRHVNARNRGATPPHLYDLQLREQPFHGVQALRLNPVGGSGVFGRTGLLAHTYMLGPKGDSNGCVSFKDYSAFLQAYANGEVKRLVVVAGLG